VRELLRTLDEAIHDKVTWGEAGGVRVMPGTYSLHSYPELEARMRDMRDGLMRPQWWHVSSRYLWGNTQWVRVPYRRTLRGPTPQLPPRAEERIQGETERILLPGGVVEHVMWVKCYAWSDAVIPEFVNQGVDVLVETMHGGDTSKLLLPKPFLYRMLGLPGGEASGRQAGASHVPHAQEPATQAGW